MANPLGNPEDQNTISITDTLNTVTVDNIGLQSIEFVNTGSKDCFYGGTSVTAAKGAPIFSQGGRRTFENIPSGWNISFICKTGQNTTLRRIDYK